MARHGDAAAFAGGQGGNFRQGIRARGRAAVRRARRILRDSEDSGLLSLLQLLDNPLQDVPCIAVLRSPLVGLSLDELAEIRLAATGGHFGRRSIRSKVQSPKSKVKRGRKLENFWTRFSSLAETGATVFALAMPRNGAGGNALRRLAAIAVRAARNGAANVERFLNLAQRFDQFQRQGLFRFLKFIEAHSEAGGRTGGRAGRERKMPCA